MLISYHGFFDERSSSRIAGNFGSQSDELADLAGSDGCQQTGRFPGSRLGTFLDDVGGSVSRSIPRASAPACRCRLSRAFRN
ncbi:MAG: hypothetical protein IPI17_17405 [Nitrosomonas sp.]|nr:hypothetical protein [Nitrosomonas sp.]